MAVCRNTQYLKLPGQLCKTNSVLGNKTAREFWARFKFRGGSVQQPAPGPCASPSVVRESGLVFTGFLVCIQRVPLIQGKFHRGGAVLFLSTTAPSTLHGSQHMVCT